MFRPECPPAISERAGRDAISLDLICPDVPPFPPVTTGRFHGNALEVNVTNNWKIGIAYAAPHKRQTTAPSRVASHRNNPGLTW
ncbi:UDP-N-acetylmuramyl peptide synthase [Anopheles sinensis]|uniref:UDP-N-acetylmuramyl peptide synthase n=1 Tax=Anopheles sinensis TaxID=74873 RepID=A0A084VK53_ANOSI|nr:UDP-N-acetylmuramyl peptide synthase [Anopheles sinensis]